MMYILPNVGTDDRTFVELRWSLGGCNNPFIHGSDLCRPEGISSYGLHAEAFYMLIREIRLGYPTRIVPYFQSESHIQIFRYQMARNE
jgi:hypothetical protein